MSNPRLVAPFDVAPRVGDIHAMRPTMPGECAVLGAAILGAVGTGVFVDAEDAVAAIVLATQAFEPRAEYRGCYSLSAGSIERAARAGVSPWGAVPGYAEARRPRHSLLMLALCCGR